MAYCMDRRWATLSASILFLVGATRAALHGSAELLIDLTHLRRHKDKLGADVISATVEACQQHFLKGTKGGLGGGGRYKYISKYGSVCTSLIRR